MEKNDKFTGLVCDINDDGDGVVKCNDEVIFVSNTWLDEEVSGVIINAKSKFAIGKAQEITNTSQHRITPPCPYSGSCGGCTLQHIDYNTQIKFKHKKLQHIFKKVAGVEPVIDEVVSSSPLRYRNKIALPVNEKNEIGMFRKNSHNIIQIDDCLISKAWTKNIISAVKEYMSENFVSGYNEKTKTGLIKHIVAREVNNSILITIVINGNKLPAEQNLINKLKNAFTNFGLNVNINTLHNNVILSNNFKHVYGLTELIATDGDISYPITNASFMQVNDEIATKIYNHVMTFINKNDVVVNAYSGAGLLSAKISKFASVVYGIEIIKEASLSADALAKNNNITNMVNICGDCTEEIPKLLNSGLNNHIIVVDPPRKGCDEKVLSAITNSKPKRIIYVSCNPNTLARDIKIITETSDYKISNITPFDMFPNTAHIETVAVLEKF